MRIFFALAALLASSFAAADVTSTRITAYDWRCTPTDTAKASSNHQRFDLAFLACVNQGGGIVQGGQYKVTATATAPAPSPTTGSATVSWTPPAKNSDGSALTDLAGYRIVYGTSASALTQTLQIANPGATSQTIGNLAAGTYYFAVKSYTSTGIESAPSQVVSKTI